MLSYRHAFHAGNHADVLKHAVQSLLLEALKAKDKPFCYIDTHAGGGCYDLSGEWSQKKAEFEDGIARLWSQPADWPELTAYLGSIAALNDEQGLRFYPGSPELARHLLREQDKLMLMELHNNEVEILRRHLGADLRVAIHHRDGFEGLQALLPPTPRRGLVLIDPPYELKTDYDKAVKGLEKALRRWPTGIYALWYPILGKEADRSREMLARLAALPLPSLLKVELEVAEQPEDWGMNGSGLAIINAPWQLDSQLNALLPRLCDRLQQENGAKWIVEWLTEQK